MPACPQHNPHHHPCNSGIDSAGKPLYVQLPRVNRCYCCHTSASTTEPNRKSGLRPAKHRVNSCDLDEHSDQATSSPPALLAAPVPGKASIHFARTTTTHNRRSQQAAVLWVQCKLLACGCSYMMFKVRLCQLHHDKAMPDAGQDPALVQGPQRPSRAKFEQLCPVPQDA